MKRYEQAQEQNILEGNSSVYKPNRDLSFIAHQHTEAEVHTSIDSYEELLYEKKSHSQ